MITLEEKTRLYLDKDAEDYFPLKINYKVFANKFVVGTWLKENIGRTKEDWMNFMVTESEPYVSDPYIAFKNKEDRNLFKVVWHHLLEDYVHEPMDWYYPSIF